MNPEVYFWIAVLLILLVFEAATVGLHAIWFAIGAAFAAFAAAIRLPVPIQITVFLLISLLLFVLLRPFARKMTRVKRAATNADRVLEMVGVVTEQIDNLAGKGAVYIDGKTWTARSYSGQDISIDTHVVVTLIDGVKLVVAPVENRNSTSNS